MKNTRKNSRKKHMKDIKIFLFKKKEKRPNKNLPEEQKKKLA